MGVHDGHRARKRQQYLLSGQDGLADHELLEMLLYYVIPRQDTNLIAHRLLDTFHSLPGVLSASVEELERVEGIGENAALLLHLSGDIGQRTRCKPLSAGDRLNSVNKAGDYFSELLWGEKKEKLYQVNLDSRGAVLSVKCLTEGTVDSAAITTRQLVESALFAGASDVMLCHNHPSGVALPSDTDVTFTKEMQAVLKLLGIRLVDHIVVANGDFVSMAQSGMLL